MLAFDKNERIKIPDVTKHPWLNSKVASRFTAEETLSRDLKKNPQKSGEAVQHVNKV